MNHETPPPRIDPVELAAAYNQMLTAIDDPASRRILAALTRERVNTATLLQVIAYAVCEAEAVSMRPDFVLPCLAIMVGRMRQAVAKAPNRHAARPVSPPGRA